jgi:tetratricopeptide (TPR) repeat protein
MRLNSSARSCRKKNVRAGIGPGRIGFHPKEGGGMGRRAVISGCCVALALMPGCAGVRLHRDRDKTVEPSAQSVSREDLSQAATVAMDKGDYTQARADLERLVGQSPRSAELHFRLGKVMQFQGELVGAEAEYRKALGLDPYYVGALVGLGQIDARLGRPSDALTRFEKAIEVDPHHAEAHFARGQTLEVLGRRDDALAAYFLSIQIDPSSASAPAMVRVAALQLDRGQADQALVRLEQANELSPDNPEIRYRRGLTLLALKKPKPAIADFSFASEKAPDRVDVLLGLAQALEADRQPLLARQALDRALRLQPDSPVAREISERLRR